MSLERVMKALIGLGLSRVDAEVYIYTAKKGSQKMSDLKQSLNYSKIQINQSLKTLTIFGLVEKDGLVFSAIPFEDALELLINRKKKETNNFQKSEKEFLVNWKKED